MRTEGRARPRFTFREFLVFNGMEGGHWLKLDRAAKGESNDDSHEEVPR